MKRLLFFLIAFVFAIQGWTQTPATLPYSCGFEDVPENSNWVISNGTSANQWSIGQAVVAAPITGNSLYISNDNGVTNTYSTSSTCAISASRIIEFDGSGSYALSFNARLGGESSYDFIKVFLVDTNVAFPGGTTTPTWASTTYSTGAILYNGTNPYYNSVGSPNIVNNIQIIIPSQGAAGTVKKLVFVWRNDSGGGTQPPAAIDNIALRALTCSAPTSPIASNATTTSFDLSWTDPNNASSWIVEYKLAASSTWIAEEALTNPYTISNLSSSSSYQARVYAVCTPGDTSFASPTIGYSTTCDVISQFPWTEGFEANWVAAIAPGNQSSPNCWTVVDKGGTNGTYQYWWKKGTTPAHTGGGHAVCYTDYGTSGHNDWLITPQLSLTGNERLRFWAMRSSSSTTEPDEISVFISDGVITSLDTTGMGVSGNMPGFTQIFTQLLPVADWQQYEISLSQYSGNRYIAFVRQNTPDGYNLRLDDVSVEPIPACARPTQLATTAVSQITADFSWIEGNIGDASWYLYYKTSAATLYDSVQVTSNPFQLPGLTQNTAYTVYMRTDCSTELSEATPTINFRTPCDPITTLPYSESFDTYGTGSTIIPSCWTKITTYSTYPYLTTTYSSSPASMYFYSTTGTYNIATTPPFDATIPINTLKASFKFRKGSTTSNMIVGVMTNPNDPNTFDSIATVAPTATSVWETFEVNFNNYQGTGQYIAFKVAYNTTTNYGYLDDLSVDVIPLCPDTYSLQVASATSTDITLNWSSLNSAGQGWEVSYDAVGTGFDPTTGTIIPVADAVGVPPYTVPGLTPSTPYSFAVRQACGGNWSNIVTVNTMGLPAQLPYSCDFENVSELNSWSLSNGGATNKWFIGTAVSATPITGNSLYISSDNGVSNTYNTGTVSTVVASRLIEFDGAGGYTLTFDSRLGGESSFDYIKVYVVNQDTTYVGADASVPYYGVNSYSTGIVLFNGTNPYFNNVNNPTTVNNHSVVLPYQGVAGTVRKLMFVWKNDGSGGTTPPASIDNITITPITCAAPSLTISNISQTTADASWSSTASDAAWWLYLKQASATVYDSIYITGTPSYSFTTLTANTAYNAYVRLDCGTELSSPSVIRNFRTACDAISTLPFFENFEGYGTGTSIMPACWVRTTTYADRPYVNSGGYSGNCLYFYAGTAGTYNIAAMNPIDASIPISTLMATFYYKNLSATDRFIVGVMADPTNATTFDSITTIAAPTTGTWAEYEVNFSSYTGTGTYIAFKNIYTTTYGYAYLDNLVVDIIPSCARPISATATNITGTTADLSWVPGNTTDAAWKIYYRPSGTSVWDSVMVTNNPYNLTGLLPSTNYEVGISTDCGTGVFSNMRLMNFRTQCGAITSIPWTDNFDSYGTGTTIFPGCWTRNTTYADRPYVHATSYSSPGSLYFYSATAGTYNIAATPMFDQTINISSLRARFMFRNMNVTDTLKVGVMTDPSQETTFVEVGRVSHLSEEVWVADTISFANYTGTGQYIAFRIDRYSTTSQWSWMDDLVIEYDATSTPCPQPTNLVVTPSNITATVSWSAGAEAAWEVRLGTTGTPVPVTTPNYTIPSLSPGTPYTVYVRSNCGTGYSSWVSAQFTTTTAPTPPSVTTTVPTTQIAQFAATFNGTYVQGTDPVTAIGFEYKTTAATTWTDQSVTPVASPFTYQATTLTANTSYMVRAYAVTATEGRVYGNTIPFTTLAIIPPTVTTDSVRNVTQTSATFYGKITANTEQIEARGFEYKLSTEAWADAIIISATGVTNIYASPTTLQDGRTYNVRAYGRTLSDTSYGQTLTFSTLTAPTVTTTPTQAADVQSTTATLKGTVTSAGNALPSQVAVGFVYSTTTNPVIGATGVLQAEATYSTTDPNFTTQITQLVANTNYFVKAYITNPVTTAYGNEVNFTTLGLLGVDGKEISIMMYPNPATSQTNLIVEGVSGETKIVLSDVQGRILNTINTKAVNGVVEQTIDLNNLTKGVYYIRIQNSYINRTQKLIVK